ncbi:MAG: glycine cleavage system aminomethyltransferase GcvT [Burkholderiales bacterium]
MSQPAARRTPLFDAHLARGAKMVDFGGWQMPLHYGSQVEEHHAVRRATGVFDVSHMCSVDVGGAGSRAFLRRLIANDVARLAAPGKALYSCMLNEAGGVLDDLIVYWLGGERYRVVVNAAVATRDQDWMRRVAASSHDLLIAPRNDLAMLAVQGPKARDAVWQARPEWRAASERLSGFFAAEVSPDFLVARTGYTGEDGFEVTLPAQQSLALWNALLAAGVAPCGLGARDTLRLEAGMNLYGQEMTESTTPLESGLAWTDDRSDPARDFVGRRALEASTPSRRLLGLKLLERGVLRSHMKVRTAQGEGETTSGTFSPTLGIAIAMARLPLACAAGDRAEIEVRGKWLPAQIVKLPFVRNGKALD